MSSIIIYGYWFKDMNRGNEQIKLRLNGEIFKLTINGNHSKFLR